MDSSVLMIFKFTLIIDLPNQYQFNEHMKKNASCRTIRTNLTSPTNAVKVIKKSPHLDLLSCRNQQAPKIEIPISAKSPLQTGMRKKMFSNSKLMLNNQNLSQVNIAPGSPTGILGESTRAYDQLKNKINNLEGRLVEIKKNFQLSFQKRNQKSKMGKENESLREKQKSKLVLQRNDQKSEKEKIEKHQKFDQGANKQNKDKQHSVRKKQIQLKGDKADSMLHQYVTTFTCQSPRNTLLQCTSQANLFKGNKISKQVKINKYYISALINAFSVGKPTSFDQLCKTHLIASLDILHFIKNANRPMPPTPIAKSLPLINKPTLIFDLDETLIHCNEHANMPCDVLLPIRFPNGAMVKAGVNIRPWAKECLQELSKQFEIMVFTASHQCYANVIIDHIDPKRLITQRFFRDSCWKSEEGFYVKDLRIIDRDLKNVLLIDNAAYSYCFQLDNGVPIVPFYDNKADLQLKSLTFYIKSLGSNTNIRSRNSSIMRLGDYCSHRQPRDILTRLYNWES